MHGLAPFHVMYYQYTAWTEHAATVARRADAPARATQSWAHPVVVARPEPLGGTRAPPPSVDKHWMYAAHSRFQLAKTGIIGIIHLMFGRNTFGFSPLGA
jgi:hypothetical protein